MIRIIISITLLMILALAIPGAAAQADFDPLDSNANSLNLELIASPQGLHHGDIIRYRVIVSVPLADPGEDFYPGKQTGVVVKFTPPGGPEITFPTIAVLNRGDSVSFNGTDNAAMNYVIDHADEDVQGQVLATSNATGTCHCSPNNSPSLNQRQITNQIVHQPAITVTKLADTTLSKATDSIGYSIEIENTGDIDLNRVSVTDSLLGIISNDFPAVLTIGSPSGPVLYNYVVQAGDDDPLLNEVTAIYEDAQGTDATGMASATVDLVDPSIEVTKESDKPPAQRTETKRVVYPTGVTDPSRPRLRRG